MATSIDETGPLSAVFYSCLAISLVGCGLFFDHLAAIDAPHVLATTSCSASQDEQLAPEIQRVAQWTAEDHNAAGLPFVVIDISQGLGYAFDSSGHLCASAPATHSDDDFSKLYRRPFEGQSNVVYLMPEIFPETSTVQTPPPRSVTARSALSGSLLKHPS